MLYFVAGKLDASLSEVVKATLSLVAAYILTPLFEVSVNAFRAPSIELQRVNQQLTSDLEATNAEIARLRAELTATTRSAARLSIAEENDMVYVELHNDGPSGKFWTQQRLTGVQSAPTKVTQAYWDSHHDTDRLYIARDTTERLRIARKVVENGTMRYEVYWQSSFSRKFCQSLNTSVLADPTAQNWSSEVALTVIADPELEGGPIKMSVILQGDGQVFLRD